MSEESVEVVRRIHDAWRDGRSAEALMDPEIEYVNPDYAVEPGTVRGVERFSGIVDRIRDTYAEFEVRPTRLIDAGDEVVVLARVSGRGRESGVPIEREQGYVWRVENGRAVRFRWFNTPGEALEAAGLPPDRSAGADPAG